MNRRDFGSMIVGMPLLDLEGRVNAYEVAGKASALGARLDRLRLCADFVNAAFPNDVWPSKQRKYDNWRVAALAYHRVWTAGEA